MTEQNCFAGRVDMPPLLEFADGRLVKTRSDWEERKKEIRELMCKYYIGTFPEHTPAILDSSVLSERQTDNATIKRIQLTLDTSNKVSYEIEVWIPRSKGPYPLMLTAPRYYQMGWAKTALARGYMVCLYPGVDSHHEESDYPGYDSKWSEIRKEYPEATWTEMAVKAWTASRTLDYLLAPNSGYSIIIDNIGIIGHSRYGKQSIIATAFDTRFTCVIARSPGTPASCSYRFASRSGFNEAPEDFAGEWFLPELRSYTGREDQLPIDVSGWYGLIAPRHCMLHIGCMEDGDPTFGVEQTYLEARKAYRFLGHAENIRVMYREGGHNDVDEFINTDSQNHNLDWFDLAFNRGSVTIDRFPEQFLHEFDWKKWKSEQPKTYLQVPAAFSKEAVSAEDKRERIEWFMGKPAENINDWKNEGRFFTEQQSFDSNHDVGQLPNVKRVPVLFGSGIKGNVYYDTTAKEPMPLVIWLHPYTYGTGLGEGYGVQEATLFHRLAAHGYMVLGYDQVGFGTRLLEGTDFYKNHPQWSRMGRMAADVSAAIDFMTEGKGRSASLLPQISKKQIFLMGYMIGGTVALYAAALDDRVAGTASFCGFTPMRTDTELHWMYEKRAFMPLLGLYAGKQNKLPFDYDTVISLIAPRPCLLVTPKRDRFAQFEDIAPCVESARSAWEQVKDVCKLTNVSPDDTSRFQKDQQLLFIDWMDKIIGNDM